jgi:hypothetical protein
MHNGKIKANTHNDTVDTLETPVWGKPAIGGLVQGTKEEKECFDATIWLEALESKIHLLDDEEIVVNT